MEVRGGGLMKFLVAILGLFLASAVSAQTSPRRDVPKYNPAAESVFKGTVDNVIERRCPVSGGVGSHILLACRTTPRSKFIWPQLNSQK
jgi:hypothetical protein